MAYTQIKLGVNDKELRQTLKQDEKLVKNFKVKIDELSSKKNFTIGNNIKQSAKAAADAVQGATAAMKRRHL